MTKLQNILMNLKSDESGQDLIEYALIASVVGLAAVASLGTLATSITGIFTNIGTKITNGK